MSKKPVNRPVPEYIEEKNSDGSIRHRFIRGNLLGKVSSNIYFLFIIFIYFFLNF